MGLSHILIEIIKVLSQRKKGKGQKKKFPVAPLGLTALLGVLDLYRVGPRFSGQELKQKHFRLPSTIYMYIYIYTPQQVNISFIVRSSVGPIKTVNDQEFFKEKSS